MENETVTKTCKICGETKDIREFYNNQRRCKVCNTKYAREWKRRHSPDNSYKKDPLWKVAQKLAANCSSGKSINARRGNYIDLDKSLINSKRIYDMLKIQKECEYCETPFIYDADYTHYQKPSIDRIDPASGYISGNIAIVCWDCNRLKNGMDYERMKKIIAKIDEIRGLKE